MKLVMVLAISLPWLVVSAAEVSTQPVVVEYIAPEKFTDISSTHHGPPNSRYLEQLSKHLSKKAAAYLAPGEQLRVSIKDIDMAGGFEPWIMPVNPDLRMVRDIYPPRIVLQYELRDMHGQILKAGDETLTNLAFLLSPRPNSMDALRDEKALLDNWLAKTFTRGITGND